MKPCEWCGNDIPDGDYTCPYCDRPQTGTGSALGMISKYRSVNIKTGRPTVQEALDHLEREIGAAIVNGTKVLTVIHGYGSGGRGGDIRREARGALSRMKYAGRISTFLPGEEFTTSSEATRELLNRLPKLKNDRNLGKENGGITLVVI